MMAAVRAEFRKLFTVRSTYITSILALLFIIFMAFYIEGFKGISGSAAARATETALSEIVVNTSLSAIILSLIAMLFMTHEYRYNTVVYTLTAANNRLKVLAAKAVVIVLYAAAFALLCAGIGIAAYLAGLGLRGTTLAGQEFNVLYVFGKLLFYCVAYTLLGLLVATLIRNIAATIAVMFITPSAIEPLLSLLLKDKAGYLPFSALERVILSRGEPMPGDISVATAIVVTLIYLVIGWTIAGLLFRWRDAN
ncbi:MAG TPA: ABC transporter permease [Candidatus Saccharimonadales bacterium]|nr:ABC transporter permease [Candidatus Saccharimonadales bacterium]